MHFLSSVCASLSGEDAIAEFVDSLRRVSVSCMSRGERGSEEEDGRDEDGEDGEDSVGIKRSSDKDEPIVISLATLAFSSVRPKALSSGISGIGPDPSFTSYILTVSTTTEEERTKSIQFWSLRNMSEALGSGMDVSSNSLNDYRTSIDLRSTAGLGPGFA
jgi:hypothetical protein